MTCIAPRCASGREPGSLFCRAHEAAPAGQRGGWLSAEKRRRARGGGAEAALDASNITRRLWIGARPPLDRILPFDVIALCAREIQPDGDHLAFKGRVVRIPIDDARLDDQDLRRVLRGARLVARDLAAGATTLVTCAAGLNRSALVAGLALGHTTRMPVEEIVALIRQRRSERALHNPHFIEILRRFARAR